MKSKTLSSNSVLLKYFSGIAFWLTFSYTLLMLIIVPTTLYFFNKASSFMMDIEPAISKENLLISMSGFQLVISMIFAVALAILLFNFKNKEASSDYIHSLPIKRGNIFLNIVTVGSLSMIIPLVIVMIVTLFLLPFLNLQITVGDVFEWALLTLATQFIIFAISIFAGQLVNRLNLDLEMILIFLFLPVVLVAVTIMSSSAFFNGVSTTLLQSEFMIWLSFPVFVFTESMKTEYNVIAIIVWIVIALVLFVASYFLYKNRRNERVNAVFQFSALYHTVVVLLTILGMLIIAIMSVALFQIGTSFNVFMLIVGAVISYIFATMFMQNTARIHFDIKNGIITAISLGVFLSAFFIGWKAYVSYIPEENNVEAVKVLDWNTANDTYYEPGDGKYLKSGYGYSKNREDIKEVVKLHEVLVEQGTKIKSIENIENTIKVYYKMRDGNRVVREFVQGKKDADKVKAYIEKLDKAALTRNTDLLYNLKDKNIYQKNSLSMFNYFMGDSETYDITGKEIKAFQQDYVNHYNDLTEMNQEVVKYTGKMQVDVGIKDNFSNLYGVSSIYNPAVKTFVQNEKLKLSELLGIEEDGFAELYKVDLSRVDDRGKLYKDLNYLQSKDFVEKYAAKILKDKDKVEGIKKIENFEFDAEGDTLLIVVDEAFLSDGDEYSIPFITSVVVK